MAIHTRKLGKICVFDMHGSLTIGTADIELRDAFRAALASGESRFVFNLRDVKYMDSSAIGETVACAKRAAENGGEIKLVLVPHGRPDDVLRIASLDRVFEIFADESEAIASYVG